MGFRQTKAIDELLQKRKRRTEDFGGDRARALASALSGMTASAGTYGGKMPQSPGFETGLKFLAEDEATTDDQLLENIKVSGLADEAYANQSRREKQLDPTSRALLQARIRSLPIEEADKIEIPEGINYGQVEDDPILGQFLKESLPKAPTVTEDIARTKEFERKRLRTKPISDIDKQFLEKKMKEFGIDKKIPSGFTYGDAEDNMFFSQYLDKENGGVKQQLLTPYQQLMIGERRADRAEKRAERQEKKEIEAEKRAKPEPKFQEQMLEYENALSLMDRVEEEKKKFGTGIGEVVSEKSKELATDLLGDVPIVGKYIPKPTPGFAAFRSDVERNLADYIKRMSGAAASDKERMKLGQIEISTADSDQVFIEKLQRAKRNLMEAREAAIEFQRRIGKNPEAFVPRVNKPQNRSESGELQERLSEEDKKALQWARENPDDPRAKQIQETIRAKF